MLGGGSAAGQAVAILSSPLLTRLYDVDAFGAYGTFSAAVSCLACVATLRLDQAILLEREEADAEDVLRLCVLAVAAVSLASGVAMLTAWLCAARSPGWARWHLGADGPGAAIALLPLAVASAGIVPAVSLWFVRGERYRPLATYQASRSAVAVLLQALTGLASAGPRGGSALIGGQVAGQVLSACWLAKAGGRALADAVLTGWEPRRLRAALLRHRSFAVYGAPQVLLRLVGTSLPALLLPLLFGSAQAGLFWLAYRMLILPSQVLTEALRPVFFRHAAELHAHGGNLHRAAWRLSAVLGVLCLPVVGGLMLAGPALFAWVFGASWRGAGHDAALISLAWALETMQMPSAVLVAVLRRQRAYLAIEAVSLVARAAALAGGALCGGPDLAVGLYAAVWATTSAGVIGWMARADRPGAAAQTRARSRGTIHGH